jgi:hypothetical protein
MIRTPWAHSRFVDDPFAIAVHRYLSGSGIPCILAIPNYLLGPWKEKGLLATRRRCGASSRRTDGVDYQATTGRHTLQGL